MPKCDSLDFKVARLPLAFIAEAYQRIDRCIAVFGKLCRSLCQVVALGLHLLELPAQLCQFGSHQWSPVAELWSSLVGLLRFCSGSAPFKQRTRSIVCHGQLFIAQRPFKPARAARPNVSLPMPTVSWHAGHDRLLTLHSRRPRS